MGHGLRAVFAAALGLALASPAAPAQSLQELLQDPAQKRAFQRALHQLFMDEPQLLVPPSLPAPRSFAAHAARDKALLKGLGPQLFAPGAAAMGPKDAPVKLAVLMGAPCPSCPQARAELGALAQAGAVRIYTHDPATSRKLAAQLGLETGPTAQWPVYVFHDMVVRGHVPPIVLDRYIEKRAARP